VLTKPKYVATLTAYKIYVLIKVVFWGIMFASIYYRKHNRMS